MIPYGRQDVTQADIDAVIAVLRSDYLTQGPVVPAFERAVADTCAVPHAVAVNSATSALHVACLALQLGPGDWLWTSPLTFLASANCGLYCGARVDFVDVDPKTYNMCPEALERKLVDAQARGCLPKVIVPVHLCGQPCDMRSIHRIASAYGVRIIEDASHAVGGRYLGEPIGNCRFSDITVFSFHPVKIITTAEGGIATTRDPELAHRMELFRSHGMTRDPARMTHAPDGPWYYQQIELGYNYRLTELHAALGLSQLDRLGDYVARRHALADRYNRLLQSLPIVTPWQHPDGYSGLHLYVVRVPEGGARSHLDVFQSMRAHGIGVNLHYIPVHLQPYYSAMGFAAGDYPQAEQYYREAISLPMYSGLGEDQQDEVVSALGQALVS